MICVWTPFTLNRLLILLGSNHLQNPIQILIFLSLKTLGVSLSSLCFNPNWIVTYKIQALASIALTIILQQLTVIKHFSLAGHLFVFFCFKIAPKCWISPESLKLIQPFMGPFWTSVGLIQPTLKASLAQCCTVLVNGAISSLLSCPKQLYFRRAILAFKIVLVSTQWIWGLKQIFWINSAVVELKQIFLITDHVIIRFPNSKPCACILIG